MTITFIYIEQSDGEGAGASLLSGGSSSGVARLGDGSLPEAVLELLVDSLEVTHATSSGGVSALGLGAPVKGALLGVGVATRSTAGLLDVIGAQTAAHAKGVRLVVAATKR